MQGAVHGRVRTGAAWLGSWNSRATRLWVIWVASCRHAASGSLTKRSLSMGPCSLAMRLPRSNSRWPLYSSLT